MGTAAFYVWSAASAQVRREDDDLCGDQQEQTSPAPLVGPAAADLTTRTPQMAPQIPRVKSRKGGGKSAAGQKRPPQRGLGVAQLERLRLQERWKKITEIDPQADPVQHQYYCSGGGDGGGSSQFPFQLHYPGYDHGQQVGGVVPLARFATSGPAGCGGAWGEACFLQRHHRAMSYPAGFLGAPGAMPGVRSLVPEPYAVDRFRIATAAAAEARFQVLPELSSNQNLQCLDDNCEFCIRKKRILGEKLGHIRGNGRSGEQNERFDFLGVDQRAAGAAEGMVDAVRQEGKWKKEREVKEYEFFPCSGRRGGGSGSDGCSSSGERAAAGDAFSASPSASSFNLLDLTLRLSR